MDMYLEHMTTEHFREKAFKVALVPVGTIEAHGRHLPLGTDNIIPAHIIAMIEERMHDSLLICPPVPYGHTFYLEKWPGSINIPLNAFRSYMCSIGHELARNGITTIFFLNGHGGNTAALSEVGEDLSYDGVRTRVISWWEEYATDIKDITPDPGHGGEDETSLVLAHDADLVDMDKTVKGPEWPPYAEISDDVRDAIVPEAMTGDARTATPEKGTLLYELVADRICSTIACYTGESR